MTKSEARTNDEMRPENGRDSAVDICGNDLLATDLN